jgi:hypothetical protein
VVGKEIKIMAFKFMERLITETGEAKRIAYQPGNGTRYEIVYCPGSETFLFGWYNVPGGKIAEFSSTAGLLVSEYFMKKLGIRSPADAAALLTLVNELTGRPVELPVGYDARGEAL